MAKHLEKEMIEASRGLRKAELVLKRGKVLNVFTKELIDADVAISQGIIVGVGHYHGEEEIDCKGKYIVPGFIDAHMHIESTMNAPLELTKELVKKGTTTIIADPHEIVNVSGQAGMDYMLKATEKVPVNAFIQVPSSVPASDSDVNGAGEFTAEEMLKYIDEERVLGLGEAMRFLDVINGEERMMKKLKAFYNKHNDGHAPGLSGKDVQAYRLAGILNDHECENYPEALEKLRSGLSILIREGSAARNLEKILSGFIKDHKPLDNCMFCTDDKHLEDIIEEGHIDHCVRKAIKLGLDPIEAYIMGSYNSARCFGLTDIGAIGPGYKADILIVNDLAKVKINKVLKDGHVVNKKYLKSFTAVQPAEALLHTIKVENITKERFVLKKAEKNVVMQLTPQSLLTKAVVRELPGDEYFEPNGEFSKLGVVERYGKTGNVAVCPVLGYGIQNGAIATSVSHDAHNIIVIGDNDEDMALAVNTIKDIEGGLVIVSKGKVVNYLQMNLGGLMSLESSSFIQKKLQEMTKQAFDMHVSHDVDPFITLSFMALLVIPEVRLCEAGLYDVNHQCFINI